jgi:hypothetical protein
LVTLCLLGSEKEQLFDEDPNAFLTAFLDDDDEQMNTVSIRMSVIELIEDFLFQQAAFNRTKLQDILKEFFFGKFPDHVISSA